jgi:hypothetical protein
MTKRIVLATLFGGALVVGAVSAASAASAGDPQMTHNKVLAMTHN